MEMVSAIKMKKAQQEAIESAPYRQYLEKIIYKTISTSSRDLSPLISNRSTNGKYLYIIISSNKGLCGSFNFNLFRKMVKEVDFKKHDFIVLGKKAAMFINKMGGKIIADFSNLTFLLAVSPIFKEAISGFLNNSYEKVFLVYNHFINTFNFETTITLLLPAKIENSIEKPALISDEYLIEPTASEIIDAVLRTLVEEKIRGAIIESAAAEYSSRMIAMKNATDNATDVIYNLTLLQNKIRQEKITYELLDMITAKESVESG
jgi:F-type H+-transporting ATPase subunit gamma